MSDSEMEEWSREGDRVQWFRAEAEMLRWREQKEQKLAELLRSCRSFGEMDVIWRELALKAAKPGNRAYAFQKAAMYARMKRDTETRIKTAGHGDLLVDGANFVEWVKEQRKQEDSEFNAALENQ
ncbi:hypothetical protein C8F01DRAFT_1095125 [Mycena amicta]|nr:hypothetical protein C8F01DRAFT_1095125 [Mycena amicta]